MEKINNNEIVIKPGDKLFFLKEHIGQWSVGNGIDPFSTKLSEADALEELWRRGENYDPVLFEITYLGNGIFQETSTGEKMLGKGYIWDCRISFSDIDKVSDNLIFNSASNHRAGYSLGKIYIKEKNYGEKLDEILNLSLNYPLTISDYFVIGDHNKARLEEMYSKVDNSERKKYILSRKKEALEAIKDIQKTVNHYKKLYEATIEKSSSENLEKTSITRKNI